MAIISGTVNSESIFDAEFYDTILDGGGATLAGDTVSDSADILRGGLQLYSGRAALSGDGRQHLCYGRSKWGRGCGFLDPGRWLHSSCRNGLRALMGR